MLILTYRYEVHVIKVVYIRQKNEQTLMELLRHFFLPRQTMKIVTCLGICLGNCRVPRRITRVGRLFRKKQAQSENLPPTLGTLRHAVLRAHYQAMVWANDVVANPIMPSPEEYGWEKEEDRWIPVMTCLPPAPEAIIELVKCGCKTQCASNRCQSRPAGLQCTDLCSCYDEDD